MITALLIRFYMFPDHVGRGSGFKVFLIYTCQEEKPDRSLIIRHTVVLFIKYF